MTSGQISQCHLIQVENDSNHRTRISSLLPPLISAQLKVPLTLLLFLPNHFRGFTVSWVRYLTHFHPPSTSLSPLLLHVLLFTSYLRRLPFPITFLSSSVLVVPISVPSHVKVLVYWTGLKLSVSWRVTLRWICSARLSSHWLTILNEPTHVRRKHKLFSLLIWWRATANTTLPDLSAPPPPSISAHTESSCPVVSGYLIAQLEGGEVQDYKLRNPWMSQLHIQTVML